MTGKLNKSLKPGEALFAEVGVDAIGDAAGDLLLVLGGAEVGALQGVGDEASFDEDGGHGGFTDHIEVGSLDAAGGGGGATDDAGKDRVGEALGGR